jgi:hypothetical protein
MPVVVKVKLSDERLQPKRFLASTLASYWEDGSRPRIRYVIFCVGLPLGIGERMTSFQSLLTPGCTYIV